MSHVREGEIHAYLDGALDRLGETRAGEIRRHVDGCEDCRSRLKEERRVRDVAAHLLDSGAPGSLEMPPFEEILRRAEAGPTGSSGGVASEATVTRESSERSARRTLGRTQRWAWAASLVVALGTGWLLRGSGIPQARPSGPETPAVASELQSRPAESEDVALGQVQSAADGERAVDAVLDLRGAGSQAGRLESFGETAESRQRSVSLQETNVQPRTPESVVAEALSPVEVDAVGARDQLLARVLADSVVAPGADQPAAYQPGPARTVGDEVLEAPRVARESVAEQVQPQPEGDAANRRNEAMATDAKTDMLAVALATGLQVVETSGDSSNVRILQAFPEGDTLVLEFTGIEGAWGLLANVRTDNADDAANAPAARTRGAMLRRRDADAPVSLDERFMSVVRISQGVGLLVVRSHRPQAELEALLRSWGMLSP